MIPSHRLSVAKLTSPSVTTIILRLFQEIEPRHSTIQLLSFHHHQQCLDSRTLFNPSVSKGLAYALIEIKSEKESLVFKFTPTVFRNISLRAIQLKRLKLHLYFFTTIFARIFSQCIQNRGNKGRNCKTHSCRVTYFCSTRLS